MTFDRFRKHRENKYGILYQIQFQGFDDPPTEQCESESSPHVE